MKELIKFIEQLESGKFPDWDKLEISGYLEACANIKTKALELSYACPNWLTLEELGLIFTKFIQGEKFESVKMLSNKAKENGTQSPLLWSTNFLQHHFKNF